MSRSVLTATNVPELSVSELSGALKRTLEERFGFVRVRGEISGYRGQHGSGHVYFSLKDATARIDAIIWKTTFLRMRFKPAEGLEVIASGKISTFAGKSSYQIVIEQLEPAGVGALMALLEARRVQLAAEGLFESARKRRLPFLPSTIGVVTSPTGAVIRDILHRLADRFPVRVLVWPVRVQGDTSADEIAAAIAGFNALPPGGNIPRPDVLIVARGGGSLEDLWSFNEEIVVRAAAASEIPLVSAVGHETDWTLIDQAADLRAPTPTAAAELCVPVRSELAAKVAALFARSASGLIRRAQHERANLRSAIRGLPSGDDLLAGPNQRKDRAADVLRLRSRAVTDTGGLRIAGLARGLARYSPHVQSTRALERAQALSARLRLLGKIVGSPARLALLRAQDRLHRARRSIAGERLRVLTATGDRWAFRVVEARRICAEKRMSSERTWINLKKSVSGAHARRAQIVASRAQLLEAVNYKSVLARGYALVQDRSGQAVTSTSAAKAAGAFIISFADGKVSAKIDERPGTLRRRKRADVATQPSLF
jgi:exodeoxyribonuclease VII large subunit